MQKDRIFERAGSHIEKGEEAAEEKGVDKLVKVHVEQGEDQPGKHHSAAFPVLDYSITDQFAEQILFKDRRAQYNEEGGEPERISGYHIGQRVLYGSTLDHSEAGGKGEAHDISYDHKAVGNQKSD